MCLCLCEGKIKWFGCKCRYRHFYSLLFHFFFWFRMFFMGFYVYEIQCALFTLNHMPHCNASNLLNQSHSGFVFYSTKKKQELFGSSILFSIFFCIFELLCYIDSMLTIFVRMIERSYKTINLSTNCTYLMKSYEFTNA